jgi:16S rRNA pseudouridine516 synthase
LMRIVRLIANLGYGSQREVKAMLKAGRVTDAHGTPLGADDQCTHAALRLDGQPLDPAPGTLIMLHKPAGYSCSTHEAGRTIYALLPARFIVRRPVMASVGRLDSATTGLLLLTDDGDLLHRIIAPKGRIMKCYEADLARPLKGNEAEIFASGTMMLQSETTPLLPAQMQPLGERRARIGLYEGRYHQVRRMFAALGNHVERLERRAIGGLELGDLPLGTWRTLSAAEKNLLFADPSETLEGP